jgi:hypothetical protein
MKKPSYAASRRAFLKAAGGASAGLLMPRPLAALAMFDDRQPPATPQFPPDDPDSPEWEFIQPRPVELNLWGRITATTAVRAQTGLNQEVVEWVAPNTVIPLFEALHAEGPNPNNDLWYRVTNGFMFTSTVQPIQPYHMPQEYSEITTTIDEEPGFWAEVIVPYTPARSQPSGSVAQLEDGTAVYETYSSVHRVIGIERDDAGYLWYQVYDDKPDADPVYVLARHMRLLSESAFAPINPGVPDKHITVTLDEQRIDCYEGDRLVFSTLTSSGGEGFGTPEGEHAVVYKQPSRHMYSDPELEAFSDPNFFDLPGVPFNLFFTTQGHAIHGTYWHGDYGRPRSHGCLNVAPEAARWMFRWAEPTPSYHVSAGGSSREPGTPVSVI